MRIEDPFNYRSRLTMPKFIINAGGDQFFVPDSSQFYFNELSGTKYPGAIFIDEPNHHCGIAMTGILVEKRLNSG